MVSCLLVIIFVLGRCVHICWYVYNGYAVNVFFIMSYGKSKVKNALNVLFCFPETHTYLTIVYQES